MIEVATANGKHGPIAILQRKSDGAMFYCIGHSIQSMMTASGVSLCGYIHAIDALIADKSDVLLIGGAGASLATMLAHRNCRITIVDNDPVAGKLARAYFNVPATIKWITTDGAAFLAKNKNRFDAIVIDACDQHGLIASLRTNRSLQGALDGVGANGTVMINCIAEGPNALDIAHLSDFFDDRSQPCHVFSPSDGYEGNSVLVAGPAAPLAAQRLKKLAKQTRPNCPPDVQDYLSSLRDTTAVALN